MDIKEKGTPYRTLISKTFKLHNGSFRSILSPRKGELNSNFCTIFYLDKKLGRLVFIDVRK